MIGKSECFGCSIDPDINEIGIERFESAYYLFFINSRGDGNLLGKNAVQQMIVFSRLNKVNFCLHIGTLVKAKRSPPLAPARQTKIIFQLELEIQ
jgi:hypothetical protein